MSNRRLLSLTIIFGLLCGINGQFRQQQILLNNQQQQNDSVPLDSINFSNIDTLRALYLNLEKALWRVIRAGVGQEYVLQRIHAVHLRFFAEKFNENGVALDLFDPDQKMLHGEMKHISQTVDAIRDVYLQTKINDKQREQVLGFSRSIVNMTKSMDAIYNLTKHNDFFGYLKTKGELQNCLSSAILTESTNQKLYEYYVDISAAQLKAYSLVQLSYMFLTVYNQNNSAMLAENLRMKFHERTIATQQRVRDLMDLSGRESWNCDPEPNEYNLKGVSNQVTRLLQGYVDNEVNLNSINDCKKTCPDYTLTKTYQCYNGSLCDLAKDSPDGSIRQCQGNIVNCQFIEGDMKVCPSIADRSRAYNYITLSSGATLGKGGSCEGQESDAKSWTRWFVQCSNCFCYCDEDRNSDRYFSLQPVLSDVERNMVITGVSIVKEGQTFYWKVTQRKLLTKGQVEVSSTNLQKPYKTARPLNIGYDITLKEGIDFHKLSWENRSVNLDTLVAPPGKVITGIKFTANKGHLGFEIRVTKFDFNMGNLQDISYSQWISSTTTDRIPILLENPDKSDRSLSKSIPDVTPDRYIDFQPTDIYKDAAQTTVPYIDTELVEPVHPTILSGVGLYYKGQPGYGGYIAPKIVTYNFAPHIQVQSSY